MRPCEGVALDSFSLFLALQACGRLGETALGEMLHSLVFKLGFVVDVFLQTALVKMYGKAAEYVASRKLFDEIPTRDLRDALSWICMIPAYAQSRRSNEALRLFHEMQLANVVPDEVTMVSVLSACSDIGAACGHAGLVSEGQTHFSSMEDVYGVLPKIDHYGCMVDLLGRAGHPYMDGHYVLLSNIYAQAKMWDGVRRMRKLLRSECTERIPGSSSI
ncbi:unnamed protein product [Musa acuminata subsp. malaccensis]|uniref:(wild Malaysian banana) hypothetical protein n=1 Tax=Musa acuminata subsp. malaccensis TaxID=214687 RepID=A0A804KK29_MUSAM|nr:unnamed protein product [Musa acuminata subsp. malaccensis]